MRSQPSIAPSHKVRWAQMVFTHPTCVPHMFCAKHLTTPTTRSRTFYKWRKQILGNSFHAPVNISQMGGAPPPARVSNGASGGFYRCCPKGRFGCAGRSLRRRRDVLFRRWRYCAHGGACSNLWSRAGCNVHCCFRFPFLDRHDACLG